jgi:hypothetical protein
MAVGCLASRPRHVVALAEHARMFDKPRSLLVVLLALPKFAVRLPSARLLQASSWPSPLLMSATHCASEASSTVLTTSGRSSCRRPSRVGSASESEAKRSLTARSVSGRTTPISGTWLWRGYALGPNVAASWPCRLCNESLLARDVVVEPRAEEAGDEA